MTVMVSSVRGDPINPRIQKRVQRAEGEQEIHQRPSEDRSGGEPIAVRHHVCPIAQEQAANRERRPPAPP